MELLQIVGIGLTATVLSLLVKQYRPEIAMAIPILAAVCILLFILPYFESMLGILEALANQAGFQMAYLKLVIKLIGIAYVCQFGAELCRDAGEASIAGKIELAGKVMIAALSLPILEQLLDLVKNVIYYG